VQEINPIIQGKEEEKVVNTKCNRYSESKDITRPKAILISPSILL
jgi:hypothetical protein